MSSASSAAHECAVAAARAKLNPPSSARSRWSTLGREDSGAVLVIVALSMTAILGAGMLAVDAGGVWVARRQLTAGAEASALAAARLYALASDGCTDPAVAATLESNAAGASMTCTTDASHVTVDATSAGIEMPFGRALGWGSPQVGASASARWGGVELANGLRPLGLCIDDADVASWLGTGPDTGPGVHRIEYPKSDPGACGNAPGTFAALDPDAGTSSGSSLESWVSAGYPGAIAVNDCDADGSPDRCAGHSGRWGSALERGLGDLRDAGQPVAVLLYDDANQDGGGRYWYRIVGFAGVAIRDFGMSGSSSERWIDAEFASAVASGECCTAPALDGGVRTVRLCGVDGGPAGDSARCGA